MTIDEEPLFSYARRLQFTTMTEADRTDLKKGVKEVLRLMEDRAWHTATDIIRASGQREGLRRLRELRKYSIKIEKRRIGKSREWEYRYATDDTAGV